jgi:hypothetical protein
MHFKNSDVNRLRRPSAGTEIVAGYGEAPP